MELRIFSRDAVEQYVPDRVEVCISISDPGSPPARLSPRFDAVLRLFFSDIIRAETAEDVLFAPEHAATIVGFIERWRHADRLVVHCHVGQSRSPGVALGLCDRFGWPAEELEQRYPFWNRWVRETLSGHRYEHGAGPGDRIP